MEGIPVDFTISNDLFDSTFSFVKTMGEANSDPVANVNPSDGYCGICSFIVGSAMN